MILIDYVTFRISNFLHLHSQYSNAIQRFSFLGPTGLFVHQARCAIQANQLLNDLTKKYVHMSRRTTRRKANANPKFLVRGDAQHLHNGYLGKAVFALDRMAAAHFLADLDAFTIVAHIQEIQIEYARWYRAPGIDHYRTRVRDHVFVFCILIVTLLIVTHSSWTTDGPM